MDLKSKLESLAAPLRARGVDVATETCTANPLHDALLDRVKHTTADLVVKDTHHHTLAQRTFLTNTDWQMIRGCAVPLLLVKPGRWGAAPKVLAAIDPGHANDKPAALDQCILQQAETLSKHLRGELHAVHACIPTAIAIAAASVPPMAATVGVEQIALEDEGKRKEIASLASQYGLRLVKTSGQRTKLA